MKRTKQIIGIVLIIAAVAALVYWETSGRERIVTTRVLIANDNIEQGEIITKQMLSTANAMPDTIISGALRPDELYMIEGREAAQMIAKNQQISDLYLCEPNESVESQLSPFLIKSEWIDSRSSSLRRGDVVELYSRDGSCFLGDFEVLFVKDAGDKEVTDAVNEAGRTHGNGIVDHMEILTDIEEYKCVS